MSPSKNRSLHCASLKRQKRGFTIVELLVSILLLSTVLLATYAAFQGIVADQARLDAELDLNNDAYYANEKFIELIKEGGTLDYEEYWNRRVRSYDKDFISVDGGPPELYTYSVSTDFGNVGPGGNENFFYCRSGNAALEEMFNEEQTDNCFTGGEYRAEWNGTTSQWEDSSTDLFTADPVQKYGQYELIHWDVNFDRNNDSGTPGDQSGDGEVFGDLDDEDLGRGPDVVDIINLGWSSTGTSIVGLTDLYLTKSTPTGKERTFFRHVFRQDDSNPTSCTKAKIESDPSDISGCNGTIQILKLISCDYDTDGNIDAWEIDPNFEELDTVDIPDATTPSKCDGVTEARWVDVFPRYVNVREAIFSIEPIKYHEYVWNTGYPDVALDPSLINPHLRIKLTLGVGWEKRAFFKNLDETHFTFFTTVNLAE